MVLKPSGQRRTSEQNCPKRSKLYEINKEKKVEPKEKNLLEFGSKMLNSAKMKMDHKPKESLIDTKGSNFFYKRRLWANLVSKMANQLKGSR